MDVEKEPIVIHDSGDEEMPDLEPMPVEDDPDKIKEKGNAAFKAGKFQEAIDQYSRAIGASQHFCDFRTRKGGTEFVSMAVLIAVLPMQISVPQSRHSGRIVLRRTWL